MIETAITIILKNKGQKTIIGTKIIQLVLGIDIWFKKTHIPKEIIRPVRYIIVK
jgi:hypothetical protein